MAKSCYGERQDKHLTQLVFTMKIASIVLLSLASTLLLSGCESGIKTEMDANSRYWARIDTTDAIYQQGPKAQQMLFQDIAACTASINEMAHLAAIKNAVPPETFDANGQKVTPNTSESRLADYDSPERNGYMHTEYYDYTDFESCMHFKGWERTEHVPYDMKKRAYNTYLDNIGYEAWRSKMVENTPPAPDYNQ